MGDIRPSRPGSWRSWGWRFLLFLAGLNIELGRLRGRLLQLAGLGSALSLALALSVGYALDAAGRADSLSPFCRDRAFGHVTRFGGPDSEGRGPERRRIRTARAGGCDYRRLWHGHPFCLYFFSRNAGGVGSRLAFLGSFVALVAAVGFGVARAERSKLLSGVLSRLGNAGTDPCPGGGAAADRVPLLWPSGSECRRSFGAFMAGVILRIVDPDATATHPHFRLKLEGIGYGFLIPVFFVSSGVEFNLSALLASASTMIRVPIFLLALLFVRGIPALLYRHVLTKHPTVAAGLLQATSLSFVVAAVQIGTSSVRSVRLRARPSSALACFR